MKATEESVALEVERVARNSYGQLVSILAARLGDVAAAEEALGDALLRALETWPSGGIPKNPEGWLVTAAKRRAIDALRKQGRPQDFRAELEWLSNASVDASLRAVSIDPKIGLMFACAHPAIDVRMRAPLMLQVVLGLDARRIASVFLLPPKTLGQRLSRAKTKIAKNKIAFSAPEHPADLAERLTDLLSAIYAAYAVGDTAMAGGDGRASGFTKEALWLVRSLCNALPDKAEAHGLLALLLFAESRREARVDAVSGMLIPLREQDTESWDHSMIHEAETALRAATQNLTLGRFQLEASIQAVHAARHRTRETDWDALFHLHLGLYTVSPTVGVITSLAAIEAEVAGVEVALARLREVPESLRESYQPWHATEAHLLAAAGDVTGAKASYMRAIGLSSDPAARAFLLGRMHAL